MNVEKSKILKLNILIPKIFPDCRGFFTEIFNSEEYTKQGINNRFIQDNLSVSKKGVLRGLHFQKGEFSQEKLLLVPSGEIFDVVVDLRKDSPTYGQYESFLLSAKDLRLLQIPVGFAHGFQTLSEEAVVIYKCDKFYKKESEGGIIWNDPDIKIKWPLDNPIISDKDLLWPRFSEI